MSASLPSEAFLDELAQRGETIYEERLKDLLETEHRNEYVVIHVDTGDYSVDKSFTLANRRMMAKYPKGGRLFGRKIGSEPDQDFVSRLAVSETNSGRLK